MAARGGPAAALLAGGVSVAMLMASPGHLRAAGADERVVLPGVTLTVAVVDIDGDGIRDIVRVAADGEAGPAFLEAWRHDGEDWQPGARLPLDREAGDRVRTGMLATDPVAFLRARRGDGDRLLLLSGSAHRTNAGVERLEIAEVGLEGEWPVRRILPGDDGPAQRVDAADLDADGVDELVVTEPEPIRTLRVLRWDGDRFAGERITVGDSPFLSQPIFGDSDGVPGDDVVFGVDHGDELYRVSASPWPPRVERGSVQTARGPTSAWPLAASEGRVYSFGESPDGPTLARLDWPRGGDVTVAASVLSTRFPPRPFVHEGRALFVDNPGLIPFSPMLGTAVVRDGSLKPLAEVTPSPVIDRIEGWAEAIARIASGHPPFPYIGPLPGGVDGAPAFITAGNLVVLGDDGVEVRPTSAFYGVAPLGLAGPGEEWLVLGTQAPLAERTAQLIGFRIANATVSVVPAEVPLAPEEHGGILAVELREATWVDEGGGRWVASGDGGFDVIVRGTPGARVGAAVGPLVLATTQVGQDGSATLRIDPRPRRDDTVRYSATIALLEPTGHLYAARWRGVVLREPPRLEATAETRPFAAVADVSGATDRAVGVTVDGDPVSVRRDGRFDVVVDASLLPREIVVRAVDRIGQETIRRIQVVGFVDYRGWPWLAIVAVTTALFGAGMYLRAPRGRPLATVGRGDGTIEEIDG